uniref:Uncharacterized protein n=1 Tax=Anguilla anguilla TaxID=7936 RepID=A0A0E9WM17_ANGAN
MRSTLPLESCWIRSTGMMRSIIMIMWPVSVWADHLLTRSSMSLCTGQAR